MSLVYNCLFSDCLATRFDAKYIQARTNCTKASRNPWLRFRIKLSQFDGSWGLEGTFLIKIYLCTIGTCVAAKNIILSVTLLKQTKFVK